MDVILDGENAKGVLRSTNEYEIEMSEVYFKKTDSGWLVHRNPKSK